MEWSKIAPFRPSQTVGQFYQVKRDWPHTTHGSIFFFFEEARSSPRGWCALGKDATGPGDGLAIGKESTLAVESWHGQDGLLALLFSGSFDQPLSCPKVEVVPSIKLFCPLCNVSSMTRIAAASNKIASVTRCHGNKNKYPVFHSSSSHAKWASDDTQQVLWAFGHITSTISVSDST